MAVAVAMAVVMSLRMGKDESASSSPEERGVSWVLSLGWIFQNFPPIQNPSKVEAAVLKSLDISYCPSSSE